MPHRIEYMQKLWISIVASTAGILLDVSARWLGYMDVAALIAKNFGIMCTSFIAIWGAWDFAASKLKQAKAKRNERRDH